MKATAQKVKRKQIRWSLDGEPKSLTPSRELYANSGILSSRNEGAGLFESLQGNMTGRKNGKKTQRLGLGGSILVRVGAKEGNVIRGEGELRGKKLITREFKYSSTGESASKDSGAM